jgi:hypothetical protein
VVFPLHGNQPSSEVLPRAATTQQLYDFIVLYDPIHPSRHSGPSAALPRPPYGGTIRRPKIGGHQLPLLADSVDKVAVSRPSDRFRDAAWNQIPVGALQRRNVACALRYRSRSAKLFQRVTPLDLPADFINTIGPKRTPVEGARKDLGSFDGVRTIPIGAGLRDGRGQCDDADRFYQRAAGYAT